MTRIENSRCLVTGAASGIGRATALELAERGAELVLTDIQELALDDVAAEVARTGAKVLLAAPADLTDHDAVTALASRVHASHGSLDIVLNVAGSAIWGPVERLGHEHWRQMVDVNLMAPIHVIEAFVPAMVDAGRGGHLVNVASAAGLLGLPWHAAYSAGKFGLRGVSEVLRFDLREHRIGVTLVCPGAVDTPLVDTLKIVGVDRAHPKARAMSERFRKHAVTPERVAAKIASAIEHDRYLVFTSRDIRLAHGLQRVCPPIYELVMRRMNRELVAVAAEAGA